MSIIIPARNEEDSLPILLASLKDQDHPPGEIIVVVGQSEDRTREAAERGGAIAIESGPMPVGWLGKPWACYQGARAAGGDILIFLDADTCVEKGGLKSIVDTYVEKGGVVSIQPFHRTKRLYEELSAFFNIIMMGAMGPFTVIGQRIKPIGLFGPCVVISRKQYLQSGGHAEVKGEVVEDLALGVKIKERGVPLHCYGGKGTISFRMYPHGFGEMVDGWSKGFATGAVKTYIPILLPIIAWVGGSISAAWYAVEALSSMNVVLIAVWTTAYLAFAVQIYWMLFRIGTFRFYTALLYPVSLLFFLAVFLRSVFLIFLLRTVRWKGLTINLKDRGRAS